MSTWKIILIASASGGLFSIFLHGIECIVRRMLTGG